MGVVWSHAPRPNPHGTPGNDVRDDGGWVGRGGKGQPQDALQRGVLEVQHSSPQPIGPALHHGDRGSVHGYLCASVGRREGGRGRREGRGRGDLGEGQLEQPVREAAEELRVVVALVKDGGRLAGEVAQGVHEGLLVLLRAGHL